MGLPLTQDVIPTEQSRSTVSRRHVAAAAMGFLWLRVAIILSVPAFETPDTASYRSGQATRPPLSAALLSSLGDTPYVVLSAIVSSAGFLALMWALWNPDRQRWSHAMAAVVATVSFLPMVSVYEHWLVPDSLITGLALLALAFASRPLESRWYPWMIVGLCTVITLTKEVGVGIVVLVSLVLVVRRHYRIAGIAATTSALLFAIVILPASERPGRVVWEQPLDTELTMERFRVIVNGVLWADLSPELAAVEKEAAACGMTYPQLLAETFRLTDRPVDFADCPDLWPTVDAVSQLDLLAAHARNPIHITDSVERGFAADMYSMSRWGGFHIDHAGLMGLARFPAGAVAVLPLAAAAAALARHRGRRLAAIAVLGSAMALVAALLDPSSQDRHTFVFRIAAFAVSLVALTETTNPDSRPVDDAGEPTDDKQTDASPDIEHPAPARSIPVTA